MFYIGFIAGILFCVVMGIIISTAYTAGQKDGRGSG